MVSNEYLNDRDAYFQDVDKRKEIADTFTDKEAIDTYEEKMEKGSQVELSVIPFANKKEDKALKAWYDDEIRLSEKLSPEELAERKIARGKDELVKAVVIASKGDNYVLTEDDDAHKMKKDYVMKNISNIRSQFANSSVDNKNKHGI